MKDKTINDCKITILTPTYNRAYVISKLYNSLIRQSEKNFVWLIIDDGSSDDTEKLVESFNDTFPIHYYKKNNGGKHTAINFGMRYVFTPYTFIVDSDDYLTDNAISLINRWIGEINDLEGYAGVSGVRLNQNHKVIGQFPENKMYVDCGNAYRRKYKLMGDKAEVYRTDVLKKYPFPEYENEKFIPENVVWNKISLDGYRLRWYKDGIIVCEYLEDGLTSNTRKIEHFEKNIKGYRADCIMSWKAMKFPFNYSAVSVFFAKCCKLKKNDKCLKDMNLNLIDRLIIKICGQIRYIIRRY